MMVNVGAGLPTGEIEPLVGYLAKNFPERPRPKAVLIPGGAKVAIKEWVVPTPGSRPHDPLATADGAIWYTGQFANVLGRLDPKTGGIEEPAPKSGPHRPHRRQGRHHSTGNFGAHVGKFHPNTGEELVRYFMTDPAARDRTPMPSEGRSLVRGGNIVGRLDPKTGALKLVTRADAQMRPYGMVISSKGVPFFVEFSSNKIASIDPRRWRSAVRFANAESQRGASRSRATTRSGTRITRAAIWAGSTDDGKHTEWTHPAAPGRSPTGWR
jgi:virginiamycin B lyase